MNFAHGFPIRDIWPERFDPPSVSGGGEMTNMGCYAIDYVVALFGSPQACRRSGWTSGGSTATRGGELRSDRAGVPGFYALLSVGKQNLDTPHQHSNWLSVQFEVENFLIEPHSETLIVDGVPRPMAEYLDGFQVEGLSTSSCAASAPETRRTAAPRSQRKGWRS